MLKIVGKFHNYKISKYQINGKEATVNRGLDGSTYPGQKLVHSVFGKINYGGLKHNSLYLRLALPSVGDRASLHKNLMITHFFLD